MKKRLPIVVGLTLLASVCLLSGCTSGAAAGWVTPTVGPGAPAFHSDSHLPFDRFELSPSDYAKMQRAQGRLLSKCVARYGLNLTFFGDYVPPANETLLFTGQPLGTLTAKQAAQFGYHSPAPTSFAPVGGIYIKDVTNVRPNIPAYGPMNEVEKINIVLNGPPATATGTPVPDPTATSPAARENSAVVAPPDGCYKIVESEISSPIETDTNLKVKLINMAVKQKQVLVSVQNWARCMKSAGYNYSTPWDASQTFSELPVSDREKQVAVTDVLCTQTSGWARDFYFVLIHYEKQAVQRYSDTLRAILASQKARMKALHLS